MKHNFVNLKMQIYFIKNKVIKNHISIVNGVMEVMQFSFVYLVFLVTMEIEMYLLLILI